MNYEAIMGYIEDLYKKQALNKKQYQQETELKDFIPVVDDDVARMLKLIIRLTKAQRILEIGTSIGYSTTSMAKEIGKGRITTIEFDEVVAEQARANFVREGVDKVIEIIVGDAREALPKLTDKYDLIFQDVDKSLYPDLFEDCVRLLKPNGVLVAEDTLFPVIDLDKKWHYLIPYIEKFNQLVVKDERLESTILPIGDGFTIAIKKA